MTTKQIQYKIEEHRLMRKKGFPFIMDIINKHKDWDNSKLVISQEVDKFIVAQKELLTEIFSDEVTEAEIKTAFLRTVKDDFFKKGLARENIALDRLKMADTAGTWDITREVSWEWENKGIDIIGFSEDEGSVPMYISVKGPDFDKHKGYLLHLTKLKMLKIAEPSANICIMLVDEKTEDYRIQEII